MPAIQLTLPDQKPMEQQAAQDDVLASRYFDSDDRDAMDELLQRYAGLAYRLALTEVRNPADAEDIVQSALLQFLLNKNREIRNVRGWIMKTIINECRDTLKAEARRRKRQDAASHTAAVDAPDHQKTELIAAAVSAVKGLPRDYRLPVWLHHLEGLPFKEIGDALSLPDETVRKRASLGIEQVRQALATLGFTTSMAAIPELLTSSALPNAPAALTGSLKTLIANASRKGAGSAPATAAQGGIGASMKVTMTSGALLAAIVATLFLLRGGARYEVKQDAGAPAVSIPKEATVPQDISSALAKILDTKIDTLYRRDSLSEVLDDLEKRVGLRSAFPRPVNATFVFTLEEKQITVRHVLEKMAAEGKLDLEYHGDTVVFWKKSDDKALAQLEQKLKAGDVDARCAAVHDLAHLGDPRIYPLLLSAIQQENGVVRMYAVVGLSNSTSIGFRLPKDGHTTTLRYCKEAPAYVETVLKLLASPPTTVQMVEREDLIALLSAGADEHVVSILTADLNNTNLPSNERGAAAYALGQIRDARALNPLIQCLNIKERDLALFTKTVDALTQFKDSRVVDTLIAFSKDNNHDLRGVAATGLGNTHDPRAVDPLVALLRDADADVRARAAAALAGIPDPRAVVAFNALLKDEDAAVRSLASFAVFGTHDTEAVAPFIALLNDAATKSAETTADDLRAKRDARVVAPLIALLKNANQGVQANAADCLGKTRDPRGVEALIEISKDTNQFLRFIAASPLGDTRDPRAVEPLLALLRDADEDVRSTAANAFGQIGASAVEPLLALLQNGDANVRAAAARALGQIRNPRAAEPLQALLNDADANVRASLADALGQTRNPRNVKPLLALVNDPDRFVRSVAAFALGKIRDPRSVDALLPLLNDANVGVQCAAAFALGKIGDPRAVAPLLAMLKEGNANAKTRAAEALRTWEFGNAQVHAALAQYEKDEQTKKTPAPPPSGEF